MALNKTLSQLRASVRKFANIEGTTAALRHPDADVDDYVNRAIGALHRRLTTSIPDQRVLSSTNISTIVGTTVYALPSDFDFLISAELSANGHRSWLQAYEMHERPVLADTNSPTNGIPVCYRLRGSNIEILPTPGGIFTVQLWYVPTITELTSGAQNYDTISRLDEFIIAYAARPIAVKDRNVDLVAICKSMIGEIDAEIEVLARNRDKNSPMRITDVYVTDRFGRPSRFR